MERALRGPSPSDALVVLGQFGVNGRDAFYESAGTRAQGGAQEGMRRA